MTPGGESEMLEEIVSKSDSEHVRTPNKPQHIK